MSIDTRRLSRGVAASVLSVALLAPAADAAQTKVSGGRTTLTLTAKARKALKQRHVKLKAAKPGTARKRTYRLPVRSGKFDFDTNRGTVKNRGALRVKRGKRTVKVTQITFSLSRSSKVVAKVAGKKLTLGVLSRRKQTVKSSGTDRALGRLRFKLSSRAAKRINRKLRARSLRGGMVLASTSVRVRRPGGLSADTGGKAGDATAPQARIAFAPALTTALAAAGLRPSALPGAAQLPDASIGLPIVSSDIDPATGTGTVDLSGGIRIGAGSGSSASTIDVERPQIVVAANDAGLYAEVNGVRVKLADLDQSGLADALRDGGTQLSNLLLRLSPEGAEALNSLGGISIFIPGTPLGDISITLPGDAGAER